MEPDVFLEDNIDFDAFIQYCIIHLLCTIHFISLEGVVDLSRMQALFNLPSKRRVKNREKIFMYDFFKWGNSEDIIIHSILRKVLQ
jgi:hypothetical protein